METPSIREADFFTMTDVAGPVLYQDGRVDGSEPTKVVDVRERERERASDASA